MAFTTILLLLLTPLAGVAAIPMPFSSEGGWLGNTITAGQSLRPWEYIESSRYSRSGQLISHGNFRFLMDGTRCQAVFMKVNEQQPRWESPPSQLGQSDLQDCTLTLTSKGTMVISSRTQPVVWQSSGGSTISMYCELAVGQDGFGGDFGVASITCGSATAWITVWSTQWA